MHDIVYFNEFKTTINFKMLPLTKWWPKLIRFQSKFAISNSKWENNETSNTEC